MDLFSSHNCRSRNLFHTTDFSLPRPRPSKDIHNCVSAFDYNDDGSENRTRREMVSLSTTIHHYLMSTYNNWLEAELGVLRQRWCLSSFSADTKYSAQTCDCSEIYLSLLILAPTIVALWVIFSCSSLKMKGSIPCCWLHPAISERKDDKDCLHRMRLLDFLFASHRTLTNP